MMRIGTEQLLLWFVEQSCMITSCDVWCLFSSLQLPRAAALWPTHFSPTGTCLRFFRLRALSACLPWLRSTSVRAIYRIIQSQRKVSPVPPAPSEVNDIDGKRAISPSSARSLPQSRVCGTANGQPWQSQVECEKRNQQVTCWPLQ